jgi:hypothetical protein
MKLHTRWLMVFVKFDAALGSDPTHSTIGQPQTVFRLVVAIALERLRQRLAHYLTIIRVQSVYGGDWAMDAVASIQAWNPAEAHRLLPVLIRRLGKSEALREMFAAYAGGSGGYA